MSAILYSIVTSIENDNKRYYIYLRLQKNIRKNIEKINESITIFKYFTPKISLFLQQMNKIRYNDYCWGRGW